MEEPRRCRIIGEMRLLVGYDGSEGAEDALELTRVLDSIGDGELLGATLNQILNRTYPGGEPWRR
jgi:nucleotide-binding universal stress UspA family protein